MLSLTSPYWTAVFLARIVMPFSRSRSIESMTRSLTSWLARKAPDCHSIASTSVVLPWSTCATMATLRRSSRAATGVGTPATLGGAPHCAGARRRLAPHAARGAGGAAQARGPPAQERLGGGQDGVGRRRRLGAGEPDQRPAVLRADL